MSEKRTTLEERHNKGNGLESLTLKEVKVKDAYMLAIEDAETNSVFVKLDQTKSSLGGWGLLDDTGEGMHPVEIRLFEPNRNGQPFWHHGEILQKGIGIGYLEREADQITYLGTITGIAQLESLADMELLDKALASV